MVSIVIDDNETENRLEFGENEKGKFFLKIYPFNYPDECAVITLDREDADTLRHELQTWNNG